MLIFNEMYFGPVSLQRWCIWLHTTLLSLLHMLTDEDDIAHHISGHASTKLHGCYCD